MANFKLLFLDDNAENNLEVYADCQDNITISINGDSESPINSAVISFSIDTAVKLSKELRKQIAEAKRDEANSQIQKF